MLCVLTLIGGMWVNPCQISYLESLGQIEGCRILFSAAGTSRISVSYMIKEVEMSCEDVAEIINANMQ